MNIQLRNLSILFLCTVLLMSCEEAEIGEKEYPFVIMKEAHTSAGKAVFIAEILSLGNSSIIEFGFRWSKEGAIDQANMFAKKVQSSPGLGDFSLVVTSDLELGVNYTVRPYIQTEKVLVLGSAITFESEGSKQPIIIDFLPKSGKSGDTITITGSNFSLSKSRIKVFAGNDQATVISADDKTINFILPQILSRSGEVPLYLNSGDFALKTDDMFFIDGHHILSFNPKKGIIGDTEVVISGTGFLKTGNIVKIGSYNAIVLSESETQIIFKLPYDMKVGSEEIEVIVNKTVASATEKFIVKSRWKRLSDFPGVPRINPVIAIVNDKLFMIGGEENTYSDEVWVYDLLLDEWSETTRFPGGGRSGAIGFSIGKIIYFGLGINQGDFWSFNTETMLWQEEACLERMSSPISFSKNDIGYVFGGRWKNGVYKFTPIEGWSLIRQFPYSFSLISVYDSQFEFNGEIYIIDNPTDQGLNSKYNLLRFDPDISSFFELIGSIPFKNKRYDAITFALEDIYIGEGALPGESEFLKLELETQKWTRIENFQGGCRIRGSISFSFQNKGYAGFGLNENVRKTNDLWVYDPLIE